MAEVRLEEIAKRHNWTVSKDWAGFGYHLLREGEERIYVTHGAIFVKVPPYDEEEDLLEELGEQLFPLKNKLIFSKGL